MHLTLHGIKEISVGYRIIKADEDLKKDIYTTEVTLWDGNEYSIITLFLDNPGVVVKQAEVME